MLHLKLIRRYSLNCKKLKRFWWISLRSMADNGLSDEEMQKRNLRLFGTDLPHGIRDAKNAKHMAEELSITERRLMFDALRKKMADQYMEQKRLQQAEIHNDDLLRIWYVSLLSSFVLGFVDTALMIIAGESINSSFATVYGMSIMGAAALGNIFTSVVLLQTQVHIVNLITRLGLKYPLLSVEQMNNKDVKTVTNWAKLFGLLSGSLCGLFPLLLYHNLTVEEIERKARALTYVFRDHHENAPEMIDQPAEYTPTEHIVKRCLEVEAKDKEMSSSCGVDEDETIVFQRSNP
uniref:Transmembrane protein 65 n=1 Tax=Haemonchus contortus TaxID=6289 RepID=A0A7I4YGL1_HAECO